MTDYRALCANLTAALNDWQCRTDDDGYAALIDCARAALAEQPVGPTDEELHQLEEMLWDRYKTLGFQGEEFMYEHSFGFALDDFARAVLSRWGVPAAVPTPEAKPTPSLKEPTPIETVCYYDDPENLPYFVGN